MLWTDHHRWPTGERFKLNFYRHWEKLLLSQPGYAPVIILSREGVTQGDPLSMVLYGITLDPLPEEPMDADPNILSSFYAKDKAFDGLTMRSAA